MDLAATFSGLAQALSAQLGGPYRPARVIDQAPAQFDEGGSLITDPAEPTVRDCVVQVDVATEAMRQSEGYAEGDVRFLILAATLSGTLNTDATVQVLSGPMAGAWLVSAIEQDPMGVLWQGRGRRA